MTDHDESELLQVRQECVNAIDDMVAPEHDTRRTGFLERAVQGEALQAVGVSYSRKDNMRDTGVYQFKVCEIADSRRLKRVVP